MIEISILHPTRRAEMASKCYEDWHFKCDHPEAVQWIFCVDRKDSDTQQGIQLFIDLLNRASLGRFGSIKLAVNFGYETSPRATNRAAMEATGMILMAVADDLGCPDSWDTALKNEIPDASQDVFLAVNDGANNPSLATHPVMSMTRYKKLGYFFHPDYEQCHTFADEDATLRSRKDKTFKWSEKLVFEHRHPAFGKGVWDDVYRRHSGGNGQEILFKHHPELRLK